MTASTEALLQAAEKGDLSKVKEIISADKTLVNCQDHDLRTPLLHAAWRNHIDVVEYLTEQGADVNKAAYDKMTPLMAAASYGWEESVTFLLMHGARIDDVSRSGKTALIYAVSECSDPETVKRHEDCVKHLLKKNADVNKQDKRGETAIMHSKFGSNIFDALIEAKADLEIQDENGSTLFSKTLENNSLANISKLRDLGVNVNQIDGEGNSSLDLILKNKKFMAEKIAILLNNKQPLFDSSLKNKAISKVIESRSVETFKTLFECGLMSQNNSKLLAFAYHANIFEKVFSSCLEWKKEQIVDLDGQSLLSRAIQDKKYSIAMKLIPFDDVNQKIKGKSLLEIALENNLEFAQQLINAGANVNTTTSNNNPLLIHFIQDKKISLFLIENSADTNIKSNEGSTVLIKAVEARREDLVNLLLQKNPANLNDKNRDGKTALYIATYEGMSDSRYLEILAALIKAEADPYVECRSYAGTATVFDLAKGKVRALIYEYRARLEKKASVTTLIERGDHPIYRSNTNANGKADVLQVNQVKGANELNFGNSP